VASSCYPSKLFNWWNSVFPHPANELTNGAIKKTDSAYFAYCNAHHLPDKTDLVILEFDATDPKYVLPVKKCAAASGYYLRCADMLLVIRNGCSTLNCWFGR